MSLKNYIPALDWIPNYKKEWLSGDLAAGLTVGIMLIPQGMAYAMIAGLPPVYGLYAATIPLIIYGFLGTSRQLAVGPVAMASLLTAAGIGTLAESGTDTYLLLAVTLAFMVGVIRLLLGVLKLGFLVNFLSRPVITGFTSAAALIIGLSQLKHLLGVDLSRSLYVHEILLDAFRNFGEINWITVAVGISGIIIIKLVKKYSKVIPSQLVAVVLSILAVWLLGLSDYGVGIVGKVPDGLPNFSMPSFDWAQWKDLFPIALTISLIGFMESIAVAKAVQAKHKSYKVSPNQELIALGAANIGGAFFQSFPVNGGFSRTAVNDQAGAKTPFSSIVSAALIILTLLFLTPLFYYLPQAILASVIMVAVFGLIDFKEPIHLWKSNKSDFWMLIITFLATLAYGIGQGIAVGVGLSLLTVIYRTTKPHLAVLGQVQGTNYYRNIGRFETLKEPENLLLLRFDAQLYFANAAFIQEKTEDHIIRRGDNLEGLILDCSGTNNIDSSGIYALSDIIDACRIKGVRVYFAGVKGPVRDAFALGDLTQKIGKENFFMGIEEAVKSHQSKSNSGETDPLFDFALQTNL